MTANVPTIHITVDGAPIAVSHHPEPRSTRTGGRAFGQFQYPTAPLHVHSEHIERAWTEANQRLEARFEEA